MFLLIFRYVFGGAIDAGGITYVDFLVPGFVTTGVLFMGMGAAAAVAEDLEQGFVDRLRSLPIPRSSVLAGRALADTAILMWSLVRHRGDRVRWSGSACTAACCEGLAAFGLVVVFGFAFEWMFIALGTVRRQRRRRRRASACMVFPLTFVSSAYVPVDVDAAAGCRRSRSTSRSRTWSTPCGR